MACSPFGSVKASGLEARSIYALSLWRVSGTSRSTNSASPSVFSATSLSDDVTMADPEIKGRSTFSVTSAVARSPSASITVKEKSCFPKTSSCAAKMKVPACVSMVIVPFSSSKISLFPLRSPSTPLTSNMPSPSAL